MVVVDAFVNPVVWEPDEAPEYVRVALSQTFKLDPSALRSRSPAELLEEMDAAGVDHAVLNALDGLWEPVLRFLEADPVRFSFSVEVDPRGGMRTVREVERAVRDHGAILVRMVPFVVGLPPSDRVYYPVFAKCAELGVPVGLNTGIPAPPMPAAPQQPLHLDDVARFFPELTIVMQHGADPWWGEAIRLLLKYPRMYLMTSAWAPKHLPPELIRFMNSRGRRKVLFASDFPALSMARCVAEAKALPLRPGVLEEYLGGAAAEVWPGLGGAAGPRSGAQP